MFWYHKKTKHSYLSIRENPNYIDWSKQPSAFKVYKRFIKAVELEEDDENHQFIYYTAGINAKKIYPNMEYFLRVVPSAGALYPTELYLQIRGVDGFVDGIYHFDVKHFSLKLLYEIGENEGVEALFSDNREIEGFVFLLSTIYFRSAWKYKDRAFRYSLLDSGHLLGAVEASCYLYDRASNVRFDFDKESLKRSFGFGEGEFFLSSAFVGRPLKSRIERFDMVLEDDWVNYERFESIERAYRDSLELRDCKVSKKYDEIFLDKRRFKESIVKRRSIRSFKKKPISKGAYISILEHVNRSVICDCDEEIRLYEIVNRVDGLKSGLYLDGELLKEGDFRDRASYLCLEQDLGGESGVTFFLVSNGKNYQPLYQKAGIIGHRLYLISEYLGIGCSGIGAYYDDELREFLDLKEDWMILYGVVIGY